MTLNLFLNHVFLCDRIVKILPYIQDANKWVLYIIILLDYVTH